MSDKPYSPLPWTFRELPEGRGWTVEDANGSDIVCNYASVQLAEQWYGEPLSDDFRFVVEACNAYESLRARLTETEDLLARLCHDEAGLIEAGRASERATLLRLLTARHALTGGTDGMKRGLAEAMDVVRGSGHRTLLPPDVAAARVAVYEAALEAIVKDGTRTAERLAREALEKGQQP